MDDKWQCPRECPFQSDDGKVAMVGAIASRVTLPILVAIVIGVYFWQVDRKENRAITLPEAGAAIAALFLAYQPTLFHEVARSAARSAAKKYLS